MTLAPVPYRLVLEFFDALRCQLYTVISHNCDQYEITGEFDVTSAGPEKQTKKNGVCSGNLSVLLRYARTLMHKKFCNFTTVDVFFSGKRSSMYGLAV